MAGKGTGKSRFMGRLLSYYDLRANVPTVIIDPVGQTINNLLDRISRDPEDEQREMWNRIRYIDLAGRNGYVVPMPFYHRLGQEGLSEIAGRIIELIERNDKNLEIAPIQGMNSIRFVGSPVGIVLAALGFQITEIESLLTDIDGWKARLQSLKDKVSQPDIEKAVTFLTKEYTKQQAAMFRGKVAELTIDPVNRAIFGASHWGIDWADVVSDNLCVLIDLSSETNKRMRKLKMLWVFQSLLNYVRAAGLTRDKPMSIIIDELSMIYQNGDEQFSDDMNEVIHGIARNHNLWLTLAHQEMHQFDEDTQKVLMTMGTQIIGRTDDPEAARAFAHRFDEYAPHWEKDSTPIFGHESWDGISVPVEVGQRSTYYTADEQERMEMYKFMKLKDLEFLIKLPGINFLTDFVVDGEHVRRDIRLQSVEKDKDLLMKHYGASVEQVEQEIAARLSGKLLEYEAPRDDIPSPPTASRITEEDDAFA